MVSLFCSICSASVRNSSIPFGSTYSDILSGNCYHFNYQSNKYSLSTSHVDKCSLKLKGEMNCSAISSSADFTRKWASSALAYAFPSNICIAVSELNTTFRNTKFPNIS